MDLNLVVVSGQLTDVDFLTNSVAVLTVYTHLEGERLGDYIPVKVVVDDKLRDELMGWNETTRVWVACHLRVRGRYPQHEMALWGDRGAVSVRTDR